MSLLFPAYLLGLLALALPWLLHRFSHQQIEEQAFPSRRFLEDSIPPASRTQALKYRFLLALRILSLILLCLLFAQPWLLRLGSHAALRQHHIIAIDQSLSMQTQGRWDNAMNQAQEILDGIPKADSMELVGFDRTLRRLGNDQDPAVSVQRVLQDLQPRYGTADYGALMQSVNQMAGEQEVPVKLWLISDAQRSSLPAELNALYAPQLDELALRTVTPEPQYNVHLQASALSQDGVNVRINVQALASESLAMPSRFQSGGTWQADNNKEPKTTSSEEVVSARGQPDEQARQIAIQVSSEGKILATQQVQLSPGKLEALVFDQLVMPVGSRPVFTVALKQDDALPIDNQVEVAVKTTNPMPVVLLNSERGESDNAAVYLTTALQTDALAQVREVSGSAERVSVDTQHLVSARNLDQPLELDVLQYVDGGANALIFRSDGLTPGGSTRVQGNEIAWVDDAHPLSLGKLDWFGTRFFDVPPLDLLPEDRVLLQTSEREPILVERTVNRGRLLILNDRLDGLGSNLPLQPVFVELMQAILRYFDASTALPDQILVGERLALPANVQVLDPQGEPLLTLDASANAGVIEFSEPGLYSVIGVRGEHALRVIIDSQEANLSSVDGRALQAWQNRYLESDTGPVQQSLADSGGSLAQAERLLLAQGDDRSRLAAWQIILPLLVLFLLLESGFANRRLDVRRDGS